MADAAKQRVEDEKARTGGTFHGLSRGPTEEELKAAARTGAKPGDGDANVPALSGAGVPTEATFKGSKRGKTTRAPAAAKVPKKQITSGPSKDGTAAP